MHISRIFLTILALTILIAPSASAELLPGEVRTVTEDKRDPAERRTARSEQALLTGGESGTDITGESGDFDDYLNDDQYGYGDGPLRLMDIDSQTAVVLGAEDAPAGLSLKRDFEQSPISE